MEKLYLLCLPSDFNIHKEWINFIIKVSKNLFLFSLHFNAASFTNKAQFDMRFSVRLKLNDDAVPNILDPTLMLQNTSVSNLFFIM